MLVSFCTMGSSPAFTTATLAHLWRLGSVEDATSSMLATEQFAPASEALAVPPRLSLCNRRYQRKEPGNTAPACALRQPEGLRVDKSHGQRVSNGNRFSEAFLNTARYRAAMLDLFAAPSQAHGLFHNTSDHNSKRHKHSRPPTWPHDGCACSVMSRVNWGGVA